MLSFALQADSWPENPVSFKVINLGIHLVNAILVIGLLFQLVLVLGYRKSTAVLIASFAGLLWAIQPISVSSVLYIIQRMNLLSALFLLLALNGYLYFRQFSKLSIPVRLTAVTICLGLFGILSVFAKENGVLLFFYILVIEYVLINRSSDDQRWRWWRRCIVSMPALLVLGYILYQVPSLLVGNGGKSFSLWQRLITEPQILWQYIFNVVFPIPERFGLSFDDTVPAKGLLQPITTLLGIVAWIGVVLGAWLLRRRVKLFAFIVFWYLAGHLLESTVIPLELYFEHRNYLPSISIQLGIGALFFHLIQLARVRKSVQVLVVVAMAGYCLNSYRILFNLTHQWSNPAAQAVAAAYHSVVLSRPRSGANDSHRRPCAPGW